MIKLRCLAVGKHSRFFVGDICNVSKLHMNDEMTKGVITIEHEEAKTTGPFSFSKAKNLVTKKEAFRVMLVPTIETA